MIGPQTGMGPGTRSSARPSRVVHKRLWGGGVRAVKEGLDGPFTEFSLQIAASPNTMIRLDSTMAEEIHPRGVADRLRHEE